MKVKVLASGSKGNITYIECNKTKLLIDIGISFLRVKKELLDNKVHIDEITGLLISHNHSDHIKGLETFIKKTSIKVYIPKEMYGGLKEIIPLDRCEFIDDNFNINDINIELIHTSHDAPYSVGFIIEYNNKTLVHVTDTGYINRKFLKKMEDKDIYVIESNHDEAMLMDGPYPRFLKERVISDRGHLSNKTTSKYLKKITTKTTKYVVLAHLSETNNTKEKALEAIKEESLLDNIEVIVASQNEGSPMVEV